MPRKRLFMRLPADWEDLEEQELERLWDRAARVQGILPELPPLSRGTDDDHGEGGGLDDEAETPVENKRRPAGVDRETMLEQQDERGD